MRITRLRAYHQHQPFRDGPYATAAGRATAFESTVVALTTDEGLTGWGEMAPLGAFYAPAFSAGARAGVDELAPLVVGSALTHPRQLMHRLDAHMRGHPYVKSAIDMAAWDLLARASDRPLCDALGGRYGDTVALYRPVPPRARAVEAALAYVQEGYRRLQIKVGGDPLADAERVRAVRASVPEHVVLFADANGAWTTGQARRFLRHTRDLDISVEQPCATHAECAAVRRDCPHPLILDETIDSLQALVQAARDGVADGVTLKLSRLGGITRTVLLRDAAAELNLPATIEDTGGGTIDTAAILHASLSTPEPVRIHTVDFSSWIMTDNATGLPAAVGGGISAPEGPGLGVEVDLDALGEPFLTSG
jgi:L-alanine-DL-glutamate epimerase-like enolase superfamily enzyme